VPWEKIRSALTRQPPLRANLPTHAVAVVLTKDLELLIIKRSEHPNDPWSGQMALPGGRVEASDADFLAAARRETLEETGIDLSGAALLGELDDLVPRSPSLPPVIVRPFVFGVLERAKIAPSDEVAGHLWLSLKDLKESSGTAEVVISGKPVRVAAFLTGTPPVWGMTHRILSGLLARVL
jgi:8-oxo-dGTP pyrophosphatase MutT (NUDIX family)